MVLAALALLKIVELTLVFYLLATLVLGVAYWFAPPYQMADHPVLAPLHALVSPLLVPLRRVVPAVGAVDLSPMALLLVLYVALLVARAFG